MACNCKGVLPVELTLGAISVGFANGIIQELAWLGGITWVTDLETFRCTCGDKCDCKVPPLPPTPPSHYPWPPPDPSSPPQYPPSHYPWRDAGPAPARPDPLVLDLNRDGKVELKNAAYFDLNANGFHEFTRWIDKTDAFLVLDKNFNGKADNGGELFGDAMTLPDGSLALTGFDALRAYDSNGDGKIDASDEIYASLKVLTGEGKMSSLADAGIKSLNVASEAVNENTPPALSQSDLANRSAA